jgi:peptidoglycan hydrolase-like protein with peptidoglycan-binding domain
VAVTRFQSEHGLTEDGLVGPKTWAAIDAAKKAG